jgi:tripartite-type tricarboxylate transporter receptor subunit TctC
MYRLLRGLATLAVTATCVISSGGAVAQPAYPNRPIRLVVPFPPGGATDLLARIVSQKLSEALGQPVIVENKPGAGTIVGADAVARSVPDGYTLLIATSTTLAINPSLYRKLPYDPVKNFTPVAMVASVPFVLVVKSSMPVRNVAELVSMVKAKPSSYASAGTGTMHHLAAELFKTVAKIELTHVPYQGSSPAVKDVIGGQVPMMFADLAPALPQINSGALRALAVTSAQRIETLPDVPTIAESGYPGFEAMAWQSIVAPSGTPREIVSKLGLEIDKILAQPSVKQQILKIGMVTNPMASDKLPGYVVSEMARWSKIVQTSGAVAD